MKAKTLKLTAILLIVAGIFTACNEKEPSFLNIDKTTITAPAEGGIFIISVSSNGEWTAVVQDAENNSWLTLANALGTNDGVITVNIAENTFYATRSATVKVVMESLSKYVAITQEPNMNFPRDIPFTHSGIPTPSPVFGTTCGCVWTFIGYSTGPGYLASVVINSNEELESHIWCWPGYYLDITFDFSNHTILRVEGTASWHVDIVNIISFRQYSENLYKLDVELILPDMGFGHPWWSLALLTSKLSEGSEIEINVTEYRRGW